MPRAILRTAFAATGIAIGIWLLPSSVHIVSWASSGPTRIALLAPWRALWLALAGAATIVGGVAVAGTVLGTRVSERIAAALSPWALVWLWAVPYLPWLPDRAPLLLVLAGPLRWGIAAVALATCAWTVDRSRFKALQQMRPPGRWAVFVVAFGVYASLGLWSAAEVGPGGDEPHYLIISQSLLRDRDLQIENNHARGDYREYFGGPLRPDFLRRGQNGAIYSIHAPGLPLLLAPAYAAGGYRGAVLLICAIGALAALAVFDVAELLAGRFVGWLTVVAVALSVPFMPLGWMIYPEIPGALITAWAARWLFRGPQVRPSVWLLRGAALSVLPWLHTKLVGLLALLAAFLLIRLWPRLKPMAALAVPIVVSTGVWLLSFHRVYGVFDPQAPYGDTARTQMALENIPRGVLGLLFDQKFGLLVYSPVYLLAAVGCWLMLRNRDQRFLAIAGLLTMLTFVAATTRFTMWWGGSSAPARFLVPALPLAAPMIAVTFRDLRSTAARAAAAGLLAVSLGVAVEGVLWPQRLMLFSPPHGVARLVEAVQGAAPLTWALPTFTEARFDTALALIASWLIAGALAFGMGMAVRLTTGEAGLRALAAGVATFVIGGAVLAGTPGPEGRQATAIRGRIELMADDDRPRLWPYDYANGHSLDARGMWLRTTLSASRSAGELSRDSRRLAGPYILPPGRFTARIRFSGLVPSDSRAFVTIRNRTRIAEISGRWTNPAQLSFELPVELPVFVGFSDEEIAGQVQQVEIAAESVVPRSARPAIQVYAVDGIDNRTNAYVVYADRDTYPEEGVFWTRSTHRGTVFVAPDRATKIVLTLRAGPVASRMQVSAAAQNRAVDLTPGETRTIELPLPAAAGLVPVAVEASQHFRPRDYDPNSDDTRWLGCQVRIGLK